MSELRTKAGKRLLAREAYNERSFALITPDAIAAIEAEAARLDARRLARALRVAYRSAYPDATQADWLSDAKYIRAAYEADR